MNEIRVLRNDESRSRSVDGLRSFHGKERQSEGCLAIKPTLVRRDMNSNTRRGKSAKAALLAATCLAATCRLSIAVPPGSVPPDSKQSMTFTEMQAEQGHALFAKHCASCHGSELQGAAGLPLAGPAFVARWNGRPLTDLTQVISEQMPLTAPHSLSSTEYLSIVAFILSQNGFAAGNTPLTRASSAFATLAFSATGKIVPPKASGPLPALPGSPRYYGQAGSDTPSQAELEAPADDWLMYNRDYSGQRFSALSAITAENAHSLQAVCVSQLGEAGSYQASPVIYKGVLYTTVGNNTYAIDARTCRKIWEYDFLAIDSALLSVNRGIALYKGAVYRSTPTGHLLAVDALTGRPLWDVWVSNTAKGYWLSAAPVIYDGKVFIGEAGADFGAPGHVYAFDAATGKHLWTFDLIPTGAQAGADTWQNGAPHGGGATWASYSVDPDKNLLYVSVGNPAPNYNGAARPGANLYTDSVVALDVESGKLAWYAQQVPHDIHDWDTAAPAALYEQNGKHLMAVANKGGWLYVYDRDTHALIFRAEVTTHENIDMPIPTSGVHVCPALFGGVEWNGPAYSPKDGALFVNSVDWCGIFTSAEPVFKMGAPYFAGDVTLDPVEKAKGWLNSYDGMTGRLKWSYSSTTPMLAGITPTAGGVVMTGDLNGNFLVLDSVDGKVLYRFNTGGAIAGGISTFAADGRQFVAVASGNASRTLWLTSGAPTIFIFALPSERNR
jgi:alcohol dehydrogenase (cytochrome c)